MAIKELTTTTNFDIVEINEASLNDIDDNNDNPNNYKSYIL